MTHYHLLIVATVLTGTAALGAVTLEKKDFKIDYGPFAKCIQVEPEALERIEGNDTYNKVVLKVTLVKPIGECGSILGNFKMVVMDAAKNELESRPAMAPNDVGAKNRVNISFDTPNDFKAPITIHLRK